jgi:hypothetical protein
VLMTTRWLIIPNEWELHPELFGPYTAGERELEVLKMPENSVVYTLDITNGIPSVSMGFPEGYNPDDDEENE